MANYIVYEGNGRSVRGEFKYNKNIMVGDTIEYITKNQTGYQKHMVIQINGVLCLKIRCDYDGVYGDVDAEPDAGVEPDTDNYLH